MYNLTCHLQNLDKCFKFHLPKFLFDVVISVYIDIFIKKSLSYFFKILCVTAQILFKFLATMNRW